MPPDLLPIRQRVARLREESASANPPQGLLADIEEALTSGYAWALSGDAWSIATEERLHELIRNPSAGGELGELASAHAVFQQDLIALRRALSDLWRERDRLRADSRSAAA